MNRERLNPERLMALARSAPADPPCPDPGVAALPAGFATRVAARWAATRPQGDLEIWDRVSRWGLGVAIAVGVAVFLLRRHPADPVPSPSPFDLLVQGPATEARS